VQEEDRMNADRRDTLRATGNIEFVEAQLGHVQFTTTSEYAHVTNSNPRAGMTQAQEAAKQAASRAGPQAFPQGSPKLKIVE
jgi:hypothetical protein